MRSNPHLFVHLRTPFGWMTMVALAMALSLPVPAMADWYYGWGARTTSLPGGSSGATKYYTYDAALQALRAFELPLPYTNGLAWQYVEKNHDYRVLLSPFSPTVGYYETVRSNTVTADSPTGVCTKLMPLVSTGSCNATFSRIEPANLGWLDWWGCYAVFSCPPTGPYVSPAGTAKPYCPYVGYQYTSFGGGVDFHRRRVPAHSCGSLYWGEVSANFDIGKCNESCRGVGNPISPAIGAKTQQEQLISSTGQLSGLDWSWHYSTKILNTAIKAAGWSHTFSRRLTMEPVYVGPVAVTGAVWAYRPDGTILKFGLGNGAYKSDADVVDRLTRNVDVTGNTAGWTYYVASTDDFESYDSYGLLISIQRRGGVSLSLIYSDSNTPANVAPTPGLLIRVVDSMGRQLDQTYDTYGRVASVSDPAGNNFVMGYDGYGNLQFLGYPGVNSQGQPSRRTFLYENTSFPSALTGIIDEEGQRYATFSYDIFGRAIKTEHGGGVSAYSIAFNIDGSSLVTDPLGNARTFGYTLVLNAIKSTGISHPCMTCGETAQGITYDANGNASSRTDFNGKKVCYGYNLTRNLETTRVEGLLAAESCATALTTPPARADVRKSTTTWHATYRLPIVVTEPAPGGSGSKTTINTYDTGGNLTQRSVVASKNDGTSATTTRTWKWTYATYGRVLTATDPNNGVATTTHYADSDPDLGKRGNIQTSTNALGHVTQFTAYDGNGRPLTIIDPNGLTTTLTYHPRGWLTSRAVGVETTTYQYDGVGQLVRATQPDGSYVQYTYDGAHRLTRIADGLGNSVVYTLDAMGNRIKEETRDPSNSLARVRSQVYDSLNRLHQSVGAQ